MTHTTRKGMATAAVTAITMNKLSKLKDKRKAERERPKTLAEIRANKQDNNNGHKPKSLAELRARKQAEVKHPRSLKEIKAAKASTKGDFSRGGLRYHNVRQQDNYWLIDVTNNDVTYTLHNRHGAWFHDIEGREGYMAEPVQVARALGTDITQLDISLTLSERLEKELRLRGIPTREQLVRQHEEEARANRRRANKHAEQG
jgi:hypothetical protein